MSHVGCNGSCDAWWLRFRYRCTTPVAFHSIVLMHILLCALLLTPVPISDAPKCQVMSYQVTLQLPAEASSSDKRLYPVTLCINPPTCRGCGSQPSQELYRAHHHTAQQVCVWNLMISDPLISSRFFARFDPEFKQNWTEPVSSPNMALQRH